MIVEVLASNSVKLKEAKANFISFDFSVDDSDRPFGKGEF